jgi:hypothetical protein
VLHLQPLVVALNLPQSLKFAHRLQVQRRDSAAELAVAGLLAPPRQHERMNAQRLRDILNQDSRLLTELDSLELEFGAVASDSSRTCSSHRGPLSLGEGVNDTEATSESAAMSC